jgi:hypothetical protein
MRASTGDPLITGERFVAANGTDVERIVPEAGSTSVARPVRSADLRVANAIAAKLIRSDPSAP